MAQKGVLLCPALPVLLPLWRAGPAVILATSSINDVSPKTKALTLTSAASKNGIKLTAPGSTAAAISVDAR